MNDATQWYNLDVDDLVKHQSQLQVPSSYDIWDWSAAWGGFLSAARLHLGPFEIMIRPEKIQWDGSQIVRDLDMVPQFDMKTVLRAHEPWPASGILERQLMVRTLERMRDVPTTMSNGWRFSRLFARFIRGETPEYVLAAVTEVGFQLYPLEESA